MSEAQWFYDQEGARKGPVTQPELEALLTSNQLSDDSWVWRKGFADWVPAHKTELMTVVATTRPAVDNTKISDVLPWHIAIFPVLSVLASSVIAGIPFWVPLVVVLVLGYLDISNLRKAGYNKPAVWWILMPVVYLFLRARVLKKGSAPAYLLLVLNLLLYVARTILLAHR